MAVWLFYHRGAQPVDHTHRTITSVVWGDHTSLKKQLLPGSPGACRQPHELLQSSSEVLVELAFISTKERV